MDIIFIGETVIIGVLLLVLVVIYFLGQGFWSLILANLRKESIIFEINSSTGRIELIRAKKFSEGIKTKDDRVYSTQNKYDLNRRDVFFTTDGHSINLNLDISKEISVLTKMAEVLEVSLSNEDSNEEKKDYKKGIDNIGVIAKKVSDQISNIIELNNKAKVKILNLKKKLHQETNEKIIKKTNKEITNLENIRENIYYKLQNIVKIIVNADAINFKGVQDYLHQNIPLSASAIVGSVVAAENVGRMFEKKDFSKSIAYILLIGGIVIAIIYLVISSNSGLSDCQSALNTCVHTMSNLQNATTILPAR